VSKQSFEKRIRDLDALRAAPDSTATRDQLRKALKDRNNYLVSKAAALAADLQLAELIPDLLAAFDRSLIDPVTSDPQCWAKNSIAKALKDLGHHDAQVFLRGIAHVQLEPVWGGQQDSAATLRGTCTLALIDCQLDELEILTCLTDGLADPEKLVRIDTATAIAQLARPEGILLLRLKALVGDPEPEVTGQCFASLLRLGRGDSVGFVSRFLKAADENVRLEAACALAQSREPEAIEILKGFWRGRLSPAMRGALLISLGASPVTEAAEFLLSVITEESGELFATAVAALAASRFRIDMRERIRAAVEGKHDANLKRIFEKEFQRSEQE
jgi:HEAT repeat protein